MEFLIGIFLVVTIYLCWCFTSLCRMFKHSIENSSIHTKELKLLGSTGFVNGGKPNQNIDRDFIFLSKSA